jgi:hypothetical protein
MPAYKPYPTEKDTPNRRARKGSRRATFLANKVANRLLIKARKEVRDARLEAAASAAAEAEENEQA